MAAMATEGGQDGFHSEKMVLKGGRVYVVSSFEDTDYFCMYSQNGDFLGEVPFSTKIVSWKLEDDLLVIFTKDRDGKAYYLAAFEMKEGKVVWNKAIYAPGAAPASDAEAPAAS